MRNYLFYQLTLSASYDILKLRIYLRIRRLTEMKMTWHPSNLKRARKIGFRARMATRNGRAIINARRRKGRLRLSVA